MRILFANPPWWDAKPGSKWGISLRRVGVRVGSRWPFTYLSPSTRF
jgi:hypothetical protein